MNAIEVKELTKRFDRHAALNAVSLTVPEGAFYALLGPNGAGKTTLIHILMGLRLADEGSASLLGKDRRHLSIADRAEIGYVSEGQQLPGWMTLGALERYLAPLYPRWDETFARELRARFRLRPDQKVRTMSRGESMKAALLCALAPRPRLLLMDEPFTGIDVAAKDDLVRGILSAGEEGTTVFISSHDVAELEPMCDWIGYLDQGVLRLSQPIDELREQYRHLTTTPSLREIFVTLSREHTPTLEPVP
jgi:ABC-2 type transport system ATP-binding protein